MPQIRMHRSIFAVRVAMGFLSLALLGAVAGAAPRSKAKKPVPETVARPDAGLDSAAVRKYYLDGDFDPAIQLLEAALQSKTAYSHDDSAFIFKHLGVMYAARYETREKGKHYMHRLLQVEPTARILDMYASDMIYMIFKNIQDEFEASRRRLARADSNLGGGRGTGPMQDPPPRQGPGPRPESQPRKRSTAFWVGAGAAAAVVAGATWYYYSDEPKTVHEDYEP